MPDQNEKSRGFTIALGGGCSMIYPEGTFANRSPRSADESEKAASRVISFGQLIAGLDRVFSRLRSVRTSQ